VGPRSNADVFYIEGFQHDKELAGAITLMWRYDQKAISSTTVPNAFEVQFSRIWFKEPIRPDEVAFDSDIYLLTGAKAKALKLRAEIPSNLGGDGGGGRPMEPIRPPGPVVTPMVGKQQIRIVGAIPPEVWNRLGTKLIPKLKAGINLKLGFSFTLELEGGEAQQLISDLKQAIEDFGLSDALKIERG
jgi:hypothetical protein